MCGIAGIINFRGSEEMEPTLRKMLGIMRYRGPDGFGIYLDSKTGLASTRLSIIDLNTGDQPIHNEDGSLWVVLNGEIFNYPELTESLLAKGHKFKTKSDTEVLVHLYEEYGTDLFRHLNGQFAFAIWDRKKSTLLLGRDRVGIRPLFYHLDKDRLVFASEIKSVFAHDSIPRRLDIQALSDIFTCWAPLGADSSFEGVRQIPPGNYATFTREGMKIHPYWKLSINALDSFERPLGDWMEELDELLLDAAKIRLRADVPVGAYLSGGLDSTYISSLVKNRFNNRLCTFSVSFTDGRFDEAPFQERAVSALKTQHQRVSCRQEDIGESFPRVIWHTETPILRTAPAPLFQLSALVRDSNFKVVLTGEGSDEIFAGYNIFKEDKVRRFWSKDPDSTARPALLRRLYPYVFSEGNDRSQRFLQGFFKRHLTEFDLPIYSHILRWENTAQLKGFFSNGFGSEPGNIAGFVQRFSEMLPAEFMSWHPLSRAQYTEISIFLSNYLLSSQGDRMAMGNSVEGRFPFLDHRVVEFAAKVPPRYRLNGLKEKYILKKAAKELVPSDLIDRPKQPYRAPISRCFLGGHKLDYVDELLSEECIKEYGYFDHKRVSKLISKARKSGVELLSERENMGVVGILSTQLVHHHFIANFPAYPIEEPKEVKVFRHDKQD